MTLIVYYLIFMIAGDFAAYFLGLLVEYEWGSYASLIVFLVLYRGEMKALWNEVRPAGADRCGYRKPHPR